jgi:hypothetical protein
VHPGGTCRSRCRDVAALKANASAAEARIGPTFDLGFSVPALADQPFARICMANNFASTSDLNVRVDRTAPVPLSSGFKGLFGSKATYQISGRAMAA